MARQTKAPGSLLIDFRNSTVPKVYFEVFERLMTTFGTFFLKPEPVYCPPPGFTQADIVQPGET